MSGNTGNQVQFSVRLLRKRTTGKIAALVALAVVLAAGRTTSGAVPPPPVLMSPANGSGAQQVALNLSWTTSPSLAAYEVQVSTDGLFASTIIDSGTFSRGSILLGNLSASTVYYWRTRGIDSIQESSLWTGAWSFTTVHYLYDTATGNTMSIALLISVHPVIDGSPLAQDDEIGVFSKAGLCVGSAIWDGVTSKSIDVVGQDSRSRITDGLNGGDTLYFRVWNYPVRKEAIATVAFSVGSPIFATGGIGILSALTATTPVNFAQPVSAGWNLFSLNIRPLDSTAPAVFGSAATMAASHYPKGFELIKTLSGQTYWPSLGISDSIVLNTGVGCQVYSDSADTVRTVGLPINVAASSVSLNKGWNLLGYLPQVSLPAGVALATIAPQVMLLKNNAGGVYIQDYGIDAVGSLVVGQAYFVYMKSAASLIFSVPQ